MSQVKPIITMNTSNVQNGNTYDQLENTTGPNLTAMTISNIDHIDNIPTPGKHGLYSS